MIPGIDVSIYQGAVNWEQVAASGVKFAYLRATYGKDSVDPTFAHNRAQAKAAGIKVGAYHFAYPNLNTAEAEAAHFLSVASPVAGELLPALDFEHVLDAAWAARFVSAVKKEIGVYPILYASSSWLPTLGKNDTVAKCPVWQADYGVNDGSLHPMPAIYRKPVIHQYTSVGQVPGIRGHVDRDIALVTLGSIAYSKPKRLVGYTVSYVGKNGKRVEVHLRARTRVGHHLQPLAWHIRHPRAPQRGRVIFSRRFA